MSAVSLNSTDNIVDKSVITTLFSSLNRVHRGQSANTKPSETSFNFFIYAVPAYRVQVLFSPDNRV